MRWLRDNLPLVLILLLALVWRLLLWAQPLHQLANDEVEYVRVARDLLAGRGWVFYASWRWLRAPLYPLFLAGSLGLTRLDPSATTAETLHRAALGNILLSLGVVYLIYRLARELSPDGHKGPALLAAMLAALLQTYATFASLYMSETLFSLLFSCGLLGLAGWRKRGGMGRATLAGAFLGLACLTRSAALVFLPVAALWLLVLAFRRTRQLRPTLAPPLALLLGAALVITPWTLHNCQAYGRCILIETGGAYNLWAFYEPDASLDAINQALEAIPNPAERADVATQHGLTQLRADPTIILRKLPVEWSRLWSVKPIPDRFLLPSAYSDPPPAIFLAALPLDDLLYLVILCAAPVGLALALARRDAFTLLLSLWMISCVGATLFTHAEGRYRHFLFMVLIPFAALALDALWQHVRQRQPRTAGPVTRFHPGLALASAASLILALLPLLAFYPWSWAGSGTLRSFYRALGDQQAAAGRAEAAVAAYRAALDADETADGWIALGDLWRRTGAIDAATEAYAMAHYCQQTYVGASAAWGDLLREFDHTDAARKAFLGRYLDPQWLTDWSYELRMPVAKAAVDVGAGLDMGYVGGVYEAELLAGANARWTDGRARLRLTPVPDAEQVLVTLRAAAPRPDDQPVLLQVCAATLCQPVLLGKEWRVVRVLLPRPLTVVELRSPTFYASDGRDLGVLIDWAVVDGAAATTQSEKSDR